MTTPAPRPRKGFLASFQAAMAPVAPEDDGSPIVRPTAIKVACGLILAAAACFLFTGGYFITHVNSQADLARTNVVQSGAQCKTYVGGIGTNVPSTVPSIPATVTGPLAATELPTACKAYQTDEPTATQIDSFKNALRVYGIIFVIVGLAAAAAGWYLLGGPRWARRVLVAIALLSLAGAALFGVSTTLTLFATLLIVIGLVMTYIGRGGLYYARIALRRNNTRH